MKIFLSSGNSFNKINIIILRVWAITWYRRVNTGLPISRK